VKRFVSLELLNVRHSVGLLGRATSLSKDRYLTQTQNKHEQTSMPRVGFEPTIPAFERAKAVHALDSAATVIGFPSTGLGLFCDFVFSVGRLYSFDCYDDTRMNQKGFRRKSS
jgi:hypothetical protein